MTLKKFQNQIQKHSRKQVKKYWKNLKPQLPQLRMLLKKFPGFSNDLACTHRNLNKALKTVENQEKKHEIGPNRTVVQGDKTKRGNKSQNA